MPVEHVEVPKFVEAPPAEIKGLRDWISIILVVPVLISVILYVFHLNVFGFYFDLPLYLSLLLALIVPQAFILWSIKGGMRRSGAWPWYDKLLAALSFFAFIYFATQSQEFSHGVWGVLAPWEARIIGLVAIVLVLEATRRTSGPFLALFCAFVAIYPLFAPSMPAPFTGLSLPFWYLVSYQAFAMEGLLGMPAQVVGTLLLGFFTFATALMASGAARFFFDVAMGLLGRSRGGPAKVSVIGSALFGMVSGSVTANIFTVGPVTIPTMKSIGYSPTYAAAIEACSSTGGTLMPPVMGTVAFLMASFLNAPYSQIIIAAAIPSVLYYFCLFLQADAYAIRKGLKGLPTEAKLPSVRNALLEHGWYVITGLVVLLYFMMALYRDAQAPLVAALSFFILPMLRKSTRLGKQNIIKFLQETAHMMALVMVSCAAVGLIIGSLVITGAAHSMAGVLIGMAGGSLLKLVLLGGFIALILGMGMTVAAVYIISALVLAPAFISSGLNPMATHLFLIYWAMVSFITPPVCLGAYQAAAVAKAPMVATGWLASRLGVGMYLLPFLFLLQPGLILQQFSFMETGVPILTAIVGIAFISWGAEGAMLQIGTIPSWARIPLVAGGLLIAWPGMATRILGIVLVALPVAYLVAKKRVQAPSIQEAL